MQKNVAKVVQASPRAPGHRAARPLPSATTVLFKLLGPSAALQCWSLLGLLLQLPQNLISLNKVFWAKEVRPNYRFLSLTSQVQQFCSGLARLVWHKGPRRLFFLPVEANLWSLFWSFLPCPLGRFLLI